MMQCMKLFRNNIALNVPSFPQRRQLKERDDRIFQTVMHPPQAKLEGNQSTPHYNLHAVTSPLSTSLTMDNTYFGGNVSNFKKLV